MKELRIRGTENKGQMRALIARELAETESPEVSNHSSLSERNRQQAITEILQQNPDKLPDRTIVIPPETAFRMIERADSRLCGYRIEPSPVRSGDGPTFHTRDSQQD